MVHTFFSRSIERSVLLREQGFKVPQQYDMRCDYYSRATSTVKNNFQKLENAVIHVIKSNWDPIYISIASGHLENQIALYLSIY